MFLWDMNKLTEELKNERISRRKSYFFIFLSPLIHLSSIIIFSMLILGHQLVEYQFKQLLTEMDKDIAFYNTWAWLIVAITIAVSCIGIYTCYWINTYKGDGKKFWQRMSILGFSVNFHITAYAFIALAILGLFSYFGIMQKISYFQTTIWPDINVIKTAANKREVVTNAFRARGAIVFLPFVPGKFKLFLTDLRQIILWLYPIISTLPPLLTFLHYFLVARLLKKMTIKNTSCEI